MVKNRKNGWRSNKQRLRLSDALIMDWYHIFQLFILFMEKVHRRHVVFDFFFRKLPPESSYLVVAGVEEVLKRLHALKFTERDIKDLEREFRKFGIILPDKFKEYLRNFRFRGNVWVMREGEMAFPHEPIMRFEGTIGELLIIETLVLSRMNYPSRVTTKASRIVKAANGIKLAAFDARRSPNDPVSTRSAFIGGFDSTSNVRAGLELGIDISGTTAHAVVQAFIVIYGSEREAYKAILKYTGYLLIDTNDPVNGIKIAISLAKERGKRVNIRIDSGNLIELAALARALDTEGWLDKIVLSGDLDEDSAYDIAKSGVKVDILGIGTNLANPREPTNGVYKLVAIKNRGRLVSSIKISGNEDKILLPGKKMAWRQRDENGNIIGDVISLAGEKRPGQGFKRVLVRAMVKGEIVLPYVELTDIRKFALHNLAKLPEQYARVKDFETYPVVISDKLQKHKREMIEEMKSMN